MLLHRRLGATDGVTPGANYTTRYTFSRTHEHPTPVTASADGDLWLLVGTDSGFEGLTRLYYLRFEVELTRS